ncbi:MAG: hypothetical protein DCC65_04235 [Planctomycetota bacterium]|nr:MAG: hypothetical protein DCC65_04235 [Planctomycetota bacterium]
MSLGNTRREAADTGRQTPAGPERAAPNGASFPPLSRGDAAVMFLLGVTVLVVFWPALRGEFVHWDDYPNYVENPHIRTLDGASIRWMLTAHLMGVWQPLTWLITALEYRLFSGENMQSFRIGMQIVSIGLHAIATMLWYVVALRLIQLARPEAARACESAPRIGAAVAAAWFAVHPQRAEVVAWASGQPYLLSAVLCLLCVACYLKAWSQPIRRVMWQALAVLACAGSLLCKAIAVPLVAVLLVLDWYPLRRVGGSAGWRADTIGRLILEKLPYAALTAAAVWLAVWATAENRSYRPDPEVVRALITSYCLVFYTVLTIAPIGIAPYYARPQPIDGITSDPWYIAAFAGVIAMSLVAAWMRRRRPWLLAAWLTYVALILPVAGYVRHGGQLAADRYSYLGCLPLLALVGGLCAFAVSTHDAASARKRPGRLLGTAVASAAIALSVMTWRQCGVWRDSIRLWQAMIDRNPEWQMGYYNLAKRYKANSDLAEAERLYRRAIELWPTYPEANVDLGNMLFSRGDLDGAERHYRMSLQGRKDFHMAHYNLGRLFLKRGQREAAYRHFKAAEADAMKKDPSKLAMIRRQLARLESRGGAPTGAVNR